MHGRKRFPLFARNDGEATDLSIGSARDLLVTPRDLLERHGTNNWFMISSAFLSKIPSWVASRR
jgi:hypothetical protein